ncbi:LIM and calponin homology domains-containing protein 1 isoform X2 [Oryzias latipes]|uniref:LIM and calponin homology domains-containing protein 1 isoform X2 n=1 Tax=Oryzias latipes TaxID=8090 RepID=UPI000CE1728F|nr:LIM and calponin homology domains-containing protein 1 isoform X2 [Oryzias latipes]
MASPAACKTLSSAPPRALLEANHHPEPACLEAQKWIEAVTGKCFGDKDFRSALENGILLCELLSAIKPGLVRKINRLPTPIAGLDNLTVFLRGCEELGLKGSQLFDPGDLQDTSIRANLKDSDCNRKLKNVLNTVFWLGKAASGCAFYSGPTLNLKEFEGLLAQMRVESDDGATSPQNRSVRDSGYDCWDSERSESLSPPRHTRDNSLDSLDSFGSRSQHSPSPDVGNRGASDGRGSDSEADGPGRKPDVRKDDMLARRTASSESRSSIPFNQFLPNRNNATAYIPTPRRKMSTEEGEQRSHSQAIPEQTKRTGQHNKAPKTVTWAPENNGEKPKQEEQMVTQETLEQRKLQKLEKAGIKVLPAAVHHISPATIKEKETSSEPPSIILRCENDFMNFCKTAWDSSSDGEEEGEKRKVPDVRKDDLASRRGRRGPTTAKVHQFVPSPECTNKDMERWEGIRRASQQTLQDKDISGKEAVPDIITRRDNPFLKEKEEVSDEGKEVEAVPNKQRDDLARRRAQSRPLPQRDAQMSFVTSSMSQADVQRWERLKMTEPSEDRPAPVCQACLEKNDGRPHGRPAKAGRGHSKVVTFGGVTEIKQPVDTVMGSEWEENKLLRRLLSVATVAVPAIDLGSQLSEREHSHIDGVEPDQATLPSADVQPWTPEATPTVAELDARLALYEQRAEEEEEEEEEERIPDLQKDDMMARRTGVFQKQSAASAAFSRFLPLPGSKRCMQEEVNTNKLLKFKNDANEVKHLDLNVRPKHQNPKVPAETAQQHQEFTVTRTASLSLSEKEQDPAVPDLEKDDMMARKARLFQKGSALKTNQSFNQFLPVPGSAKYNASPVSAVKLPQSRPVLAESFGSSVSVAAEHQIPFKDPTGPTHAGARGRQEGEDQEKGDTMRATDTIVSKVTESPPSPALALPAHSCSRVVEAEQQMETERTDAEEGKKGVNEKTQKKPFWLEDELPPIMVSRRVAFLLNNESVSMTDMVNEEEAGHLPLLSQSRHERMHEQYNNFQEEEDHWQDDLARWKSRRRSASQELIRKEEERKRMEKMKEERRDGHKRKSIKTYKEIVEEKERREAELCEAYRNAATPEEAALVLQRYALRFTISDATLDSLKLPRSTSKPKHDLNGTTQEDKPASPVNGSEMLEHLPKPKPASLNQKHTNPENMETDVIQELEKSGATSSSSTTSNSPVSADTNSQIVPPQSPQFCKPTTQFTESAATNQKDLNSGDTLLQSKHISFQDAQEQSQTMQPQFPQSQPTQSKPVQLQLAQPQSEQLQPTQPQSEQPTQSQLEQPQPAQSRSEQLQPAQSEQLQPAQSQLEQMQPAQSQSEQLQPAQSEQLQPAQSQLEQMQPAQSQSEQLQPVQSHIEQLQPAQPHSEHLQRVIYTQPIHTLPSPAPARPVPMLVAKPYCQPRTTLKPVKMDGLVRVNGEMMEDSVVSPSPSALLDSLQEKQENKDVSSKQAEEDNPPEEAVENPKTAEQLTPPPQNEKTAAAATSAISSLIGGRSCTITTTIVTELTQTLVEPLYPEIQSNKKTPIEEKTQPPASPSNKQKYSPTVTDGLEESCVTIETPMLNLAKRVNHWVWDPNEERKRLERWQQEQERLLQEQYLREQEKLKKEWEKAQIEVEEEERKHNEEERRILEETVTPLSPTGLLQQGSGHTAVSAPAPENNNKGEGNVSLEQNGKKVPTGREDQHASKLHFFQDSACDGQPSKRPEPWKTASLDRNPQLSQTQNVKRSGSHDAVTGEQQSSPSTPQPPSPSRCVSGKRLCSGCSKPLGKGAAMIIDTLGLYFHMGCFKCGVCKGQLGDASAGTDVRIRNGQLSCHECYIASRGRGQPTTL